jgi:nucleoside-diphosphate-sugar epimerase
MLRNYRTAERIMRFPVEIVEGDLLDTAAISRAVDGCDAIVHLASGEKPGVETRNLLDAAERAGIKRFVHMSTASVYGLDLPIHLERMQEDTSIRRTGDLYVDGKAKAEAAVLRAVRRGLPAVILRPQVVYGPGMVWSEELVQLLGEGSICILGDGGICNLIYIDDLISAVDCALESKSANGRAFFITDGAPIPWSSYIAAHAALLGVDAPTQCRDEVLPRSQGLGGWLRDSFRPVLPVLRTSEFRSFVLESPLMKATAFRAYMALRERPSVQARLGVLKDSRGRGPAGLKWSKRWLNLQLSAARLSSQRAAQELGYRSRVDFTEGLSRTAHWFRMRGWLPSSPSR